MEKESALHQLMDIRKNGVMNGITNIDGEYQEIIRKSDKYSDRLEKLNLPKEARLLIDRYVSVQNALGSRYGMLTYLLGFLTAEKFFWENVCLQKQKKLFQTSNPHMQNYEKGLAYNKLLFSFLTHSKAVVILPTILSQIIFSAPQVVSYS